MPLKGNIRHSIVFWCFNVAGEKWDMDRTCEVARQLGAGSIELSDPDTWPTIRRHGLTSAIAMNGMPGAPFVKGLNNPRYHDQVIECTTRTIDACADFGIPSVIAFTGYKWRDAEDPS
ncbi:MAG: hydroxypyruvate isomerase, partial [Planctomycetota bacterium]